MRFLTLAIIGAAAIGMNTVQGDAIKRSAVPTMCKQHANFAITFNQGPSSYTGEVLDACKERGVQITFHVEAEYLEQNPIFVAELKRAASDGHCIGLFIDKLDMDKMSEEEMMTTIESRRDFIEELIGRRPIFLRVSKPLSDEKVLLLKSKGIYLTAHSMDSYDYKASTKDGVVNEFKTNLDRLSQNTKPSYISAQNGLAPASSQATAEILDYLASKGYKIVTLEECLQVKGPGEVKGNSTTRKVSPQANGSESIYQSNFALVATITSTLVASAVMALLF